MKIAHKLILSFLPMAVLACVLIALSVSPIASNRATLLALELLTLATVALTATASVRVVSRHISELKPDAERIELKAGAQASVSLREKDLLLKEIYHRVCNNMQVIISMLNLQSRLISDPTLRAAFQDSQERIRSMAMVHEQLYESPDLASISFGSYARNLTASLFSCYADGLGQVRIQVNAEDVSLDLDSAIPCGLIVNELVSNALKYAFSGGRDGEIRVSMDARDGSLCLQVLDDGVGLPPGFEWHQSPTLGLQIVASMTAQLNGELSLSTELDAGTCWQITFAASKEKS